jgi:hypothetical protein
MVWSGAASGREHGGAARTNLELLGPSIRSVVLLPRFLLLRLSGYVINSNNATHYSLWGSNPRPMAHKTIALTTELREQLALGTVVILVILARSNMILGS